MNRHVLFILSTQCACCNLRFRFLADKSKTRRGLPLFEPMHFKVKCFLRCFSAFCSGKEWLFGLLSPSCQPDASLTILLCPLNKMIPPAEMLVTGWFFLLLFVFIPLYMIALYVWKFPYINPTCLAPTTCLRKHR